MSFWVTSCFCRIPVSLSTNIWTCVRSPDSGHKNRFRIKMLCSFEKGSPRWFGIHMSRIKPRLSWKTYKHELSQNDFAKNLRNWPKNWFTRVPARYINLPKRLCTNLFPPLIQGATAHVRSQTYLLLFLPWIIEMRKVIAWFIAIAIYADIHPWEKQMWTMGSCVLQICGGGLLPVSRSKAASYHAELMGLQEMPHLEPNRCFQWEELLILQTYMSKCF